MTNMVSEFQQKIEQTLFEQQSQRRDKLVLQVQIRRNKRAGCPRSRSRVCKARSQGWGRNRYSRLTPASFRSLGRSSIWSHGRRLVDGQMSKL